MTYQEIENSLIDENSKKWDANAKAVRDAAAARAKAPLTREQILTAGSEAGDQENSGRLQQDQALQNVRKIEGALEALNQVKREHGALTATEAAQYERLSRDLEAANGHLEQLKHKESTKDDFGTNLAGQENIRATRELNAQILADTKLSTEQQHDIIAANWKRLLDEGKLTAAQRKEVETQMWSATGAAAKAGSTLTVEEARVSVAAITADETKGSADRLAAIVAVWAKVRDNDKLAYQQRLQAALEYYRADAALDREQQKDKAGIARADAETSRQLSRIKISQTREDTQEEWALHKLSADQRVATLTSLLEEEKNLDLQAVDAELASLQEGTAAYETAANKKKLIEAQFQADIARMRREAAQEATRDAQQETTTWKLATQEILSTEQSTTRAIIGGKQSAAQILGGIIDNLAEKEIDADLQYLTKHILMTQAELAADKTAEQTGFLWKLLFGQKEVVLDAGTEAAKTASAVAGEGARTAATAAGETARTTVKAAARAASSGAELASGSAQILNDAYKSAAGAYSAVVGIPIVGPVLAPIAAGTAFAAVAAFDALTSLDVGAWNVPHDMPAYIHKGESVVPQKFAEGLRDSGGLGGPNNKAQVTGASLTYAPTVNAPAHKSLEQLLSNESSVMLKFLDQAIRNGDLEVGH